MSDYIRYTLYEITGNNFANSNYSKTKYAILCTKAHKQIIKHVLFLKNTGYISHLKFHSIMQINIFDPYCS